MPDLLVKLYDVPVPESRAVGPGGQGCTVRPARAYEKHRVVGWVRETFGEGWASEADVAFGNRPISCFVATKAGELQGFACYDATCRGFFGPLGVAEGARGAGIGKRLLLACLHAMACVGYAYAVVGGVDAPEFYAKAVGAIEISGSTPGIYRDRLR
jgi:GNAT superfamily N-acetyltransferase